MTRDAEQQKYSEVVALVSVTVGREQFRNAEPRFYTAWVKNGSGGASKLCLRYPPKQTSTPATATSVSCQRTKSLRDSPLRG